MSLGRTLQVFIARHRRGLAAILVAAAVWLVAHPGNDEQAATVPALAAAHPLSGGSQIQRAGLTVVHVPGRLLPTGALETVDQAAGQTLVTDRPQGAILTRSDLLSTPRAGPGQALTAIRISDPATLAMLRVGQSVRVVLAGDGLETETLAPSAVVRSMLNDSSGSNSLSASGEVAVVVSTDPDSAARIATRSTSQGIGIVMS